MALIVEDGTGKIDATSYMSVADFQARNLARGDILTGDNGSVEQIILAAMNYIETRDYLGYKSTKVQALQWPRLDVYVDGFLVESNEIPKELINGLYETALSVDAGSNPLSNVERETKSEKVGDIAVTYMDEAKSETTRRSIDSALRKLLASNVSSDDGMVQLVRA